MNWKIYQSGNYLYIEAIDDVVLIDGLVGSFEFLRKQKDDNYFHLYKNGVQVRNNEVFEIGSLFDIDNNLFTLESFNEFKQNLKQVATSSDSESNTGNMQTESEPIHVISSNNGIINIDSRGSMYNGIEVGGTSGFHKYIFQGFKNTVDILASSSPLTLNIGARAASVLTSPGSFEKDGTGNSWNSYIYSTESFNPSELDFAFSWLVESVTGTIREMGGMDNNPNQNQSYTSLESAIYQVNNYFYSRVYESGAAKVIPNYSTFYLQVGDRLGLGSIDGIVFYFVIRNEIIIEIYKSDVKLTEPMFFKAALNRGDGSSGESLIGDVKVHLSTKKTGFGVSIEGNSSDEITPLHIQTLLDEAGVNVLPGSTYGNLNITRQPFEKYENLSIDVTHTFVGNYKSINSELVF